MTLPAGSRLGPYEILSPLGAGGMGEVYRAKDPRLGREVAVKVLPASFSNDADRLRRFEQEARAAGLLNHPNITAVYDIGSHDGAPYVVSELLDGETLRSRLAAGPLAPRKALDYAIQIARGLAAAHEKGIVHRDLKPENLFVTKDGRVKILDFGLAKLIRSEEGVDLTELPTATAGTEPGIVMGTLGYMSPEQVRGKPSDPRSDIFVFGAILWEMLAGRRAFHAETPADTMTAILTKEPPELSATREDVPPGLERILRHCLEKNVDERFHSAHDLAFDLEALSGISGPAAAIAPSPAREKKAVRFVPVSAAIVVAVLSGVAVYRSGKKAGYVPPPSFHQLTFQRGEIGGSLFAPDGQTVVYSAAWEGRPMEIFVTRPESRESRPFGLVGGEVMAMSRTGEMAVSLNRHSAHPFIRTGRLARISIAGGAPRDILDDVQWADWSPDGESLAIVRDIGARSSLEFPIGKVISQTDGWISHPRVSPNGDLVAFIEHPVLRDDGGSIAVVDRAGKKTTLTPVYETAQGLAWTPKGREIWFTAAEKGYNRAVHGADLSGKVRLIGRVPGVSTIRDISKDGRVLMTEEAYRVEIFARRSRDEKESKLSWLDYSVVTDISHDGGTILFCESGEGGGPGYSTYLRKTDGSPAIRLSEGQSQALSPDGMWALSIFHPATDATLAAIPTGVGEIRKFQTDGLRVRVADWLPDGKRIVMTAAENGRGTRLYLRDFDGGKPRPLTPEGYRHFERAVSVDGKFVAVRGPDRRTYLYPLAGGEPMPLSGLTAEDVPVQFDREDRSLYVYLGAGIPLSVYRYDISSGRKEPWKEVRPVDSTGLSFFNRFVPTSDGRAYAYSFFRILSFLQMVDGLK
ncbi:MAG TPA: protein kinase [Thermoanaerobaculia bacterium]|nr:protein kinase [Thermoanaerobaculia bacterium]